MQTILALVQGSGGFIVQPGGVWGYTVTIPPALILTLILALALAQDLILTHLSPFLIANLNHSPAHHVADDDGTADGGDGAEAHDGRLVGQEQDQDVQEESAATGIGVSLVSKCSAAAVLADVQVGLRT